MKALLNAFKEVKIIALQGSELLLESNQNKLIFNIHQLQIQLKT
jgi:hypothetical protein